MQEEFNILTLIPLEKKNSPEIENLFLLFLLTSTVTSIHKIHP